MGKRDERTFIFLHDGMPEHPKIEALSDRAFRVLLDLWCWCSRTLANGFVPEAVWVKRTGSAKVRKELLAALVEPAEGGVYMHDYLEHQRSREEAEALRLKRQEAGRKGGRAKANRVASATANGVADGKQAGSKSLPELEKDLGTKVPKESPARPDVTRICEHLADQIEANGSKRPTITQRWLDEARRLLDRDGRTVDQVIRAIDWSQSNTFWRSNILSMPKLREKYDTMRLQAETEHRQERPTDRQGDLLRAEMQRLQASELDESRLLGGTS